MDIEKLFLDPSQRDAEPVKEAIGSSIARVKGIDENARTVTAIVSTPNVDRYEEIVEPAAFRKHLPTFLDNPVFIAGHVYSGDNGEPTVIGHWESVQINSDNLTATAKFAQTDLAEKYWRLYRDGHMKAFSVGWITRAWEMRETEMPDGKKKRLRVFTDVELIEISAVAIPANRQSLVRAASALRVNDEIRMTNDETSDARVADFGKLVRTCVADEVAKQLNTDPGGRLHDLIDEVVASCMRHGGHGDHDHPPEVGAGTHSTNEHRNTELKAALRGLVRT